VDLPFLLLQAAFFGPSIRHLIKKYGTVQISISYLENCDIWVSLNKSQLRRYLQKLPEVLPATYCTPSDKVSFAATHILN
jgi:hypothetical protein